MLLEGLGLRVFGFRGLGFFFSSSFPYLWVTLAVPVYLSHSYLNFSCASECSQWILEIAAVDSLGRYRGEEKVSLR
jgi:hypothetical protein